MSTRPVSSTTANDDSTTKNASPVAGIAAMARDKLQTSAKDLLRNLEVMMISSSPSKSIHDKTGLYHRRSRQMNQNDYETSSTSSPVSPFESAVRAMFSSCTGVGTDDGASTDSAHNNVPDNESPVPSYSSSDSSKTTPSSSYDLGNVDRQGPSSPHRSTSPEPWKPYQRNQDQSALSSIPITTEKNNKSPVKRYTTESSRRPSSMASSSISFGEHIYEHLFYNYSDTNIQPVTRKKKSDEKITPAQTRTEQVFNLIRASQRKEQQASQDYYDPSLKARDNSGRNLSKPFPVSSPQSNQQKQLVPHPTISAASPLTAEELSIPMNTTFDDGISAISAHTLEQMAFKNEQILQPASADDNNIGLDKAATDVQVKGTKQRQQLQIHNAKENQSSKLQNLSTISPPEDRSKRQAFVSPPKNPYHQQHQSIGILGATPMMRVPSNQTWNSGRHSTPTKASRESTQGTTQTGDSTRSFEHWQEQEQHFWTKQVTNVNDVVKVKVYTASMTANSPLRTASGAALKKTTPGHQTRTKQQISPSSNYKMVMKTSSSTPQLSKTLAPSHNDTINSRTKSASNIYNRRRNSASNKNEQRFNHPFDDVDEHYIHEKRTAALFGIEHVEDDGFGVTVRNPYPNGMPSPFFEIAEI